MAASIPPPPLNEGVLALIGNTPLVRVKNLDTGPCELYLKLENHNPGGSIKDRIGVSMIDAAEKQGKLRPGRQSKLVEATAGNTGLGLALVAAQRGYELTLVIPDKMSQEKIFHLRALGARIVMTRSDVGKGHPEYYQDLAKRISEETDAFYVNQFENPANPLAHELTTGPEILAQMNGDLDAMVCGVGSGGTITGLARYFAAHSPKTEMVLADPKGSILADYIATGTIGEAGSWLVEGIGEDFIPPICDLSAVKKAYTVTDRESFDAARTLLKKEGILGGTSSGTLLSAALRFCREQTTKKRVVSLVCDSGGKYLSKAFNDYWMADQGMTDRPLRGNLSDLVARSADEGAVVSVGSSDTLSIAYARMKLYDISQLPVLDDGKLVGMIDESDLLLAWSNSSALAKTAVREVMSKNLETVSLDTDPRDLMQIFDRGMVAIVMDGTRFVGLVTRMDLVHWLRRKLA